MFSRLTSLFTPTLVTPEDWAMHNSKRCTPDELIVASIVKSIASNFDDWIGNYTPLDIPLSTSGTWKSEDKYFTFERTRVSGRFTSPVSVKMKVERFTDQNYKTYKDVIKQFEINGTPIAPLELAFKIFEAYHSVKTAIENAKAAAAKAKREMELNESKWNLAEKLLGMKRNEFGALVPMNGCLRHGQCHSGCESCCYCEDAE